MANLGMDIVNRKLETIMLAAADRADMLHYVGAVPTLSTFIDTNMSIYQLNMELAALWDVLVNTYEDYCIRRKTINVLANIEDYSMPSDFYKFRKVFPIVSGKRAMPLKKFNLEELGEADSLSPIFTSRIEDTRYKVNGNRLWLHPAPTSACELELWYVPQYTPIENNDDKVDWRYPLGWEDYAIEGLAARWLEKEESDASAQRTRQKEILQRILVMAEDRDAGEPFQIIDVEKYL